MIKNELDKGPEGTVECHVRAALSLARGDGCCHDVEVTRMILAEVREVGLVCDPFRAFSEWGSHADCRAYRGL